MHKRVVIMVVLFVIWAMTLSMFVPAATSSTTIIASGTIAYVRGGEEIRLIQPDGSNDRSIWTEPQPDIAYVISDLDWRPDAGALAFASNHEQACSRFDSDIYTIWPDGHGFRRVTNPPACAELTPYPKGTVSVTVRNYTTGGPFFVYVQGAPSIQLVVVPSGGASTVTFANVADFGNVMQQAVVIEGLNRWISPIAVADVQPGQTVNAGSINVVGNGLSQFGAYVPAWHSDGTRLGYIFGGCAGMWQIGANPPAGDSGGALLQADSVFACVMDWGPGPALANQILYYSYLGDGIYRVAEGSTTPGLQLVATEGYELVFDVQWLPDGSGFVFSKTGDFLRNANVYSYNFATSRVTQLTHFTNTFARDMSISPDSEWIVFDRATSRDNLTANLWMMRRDGTELQLLVQNGRIPSWSPRAPRLPSRVFMPMARR